MGVPSMQSTGLGGKTVIARDCQAAGAPTSLDGGNCSSTFCLSLLSKKLSMAAQDARRSPYGTGPRATNSISLSYLSDTSYKYGKPRTCGYHLELARARFGYLPGDTLGQHTSCNAADMMRCLTTTYPELHSRLVCKAIVQHMGTTRHPKSTHDPAAGALKYLER